MGHGAWGMGHGAWDCPVYLINLQSAVSVFSPSVSFGSDVVNPVETSFSNFTIPTKMAIVEVSLNLKVDFITNLLLVLN